MKAGLQEPTSGKKGIYVENYGCTANRYDLEIILAYLIEAGYGLSATPEGADVIIVNTCGVKKQTEDKVLWRLKVLNRLNKPFIVAGCLPRINLPAIEEAAPNFSIAMDPQSIDKILLAVKEAEGGGKNKRLFSGEPKIKPKLPKVRTNEFVEILQIAEGCRSACSFCCTRFARGKLFSYPKEILIDRVGGSVKDGVKEVWLTAQDTGAYGRDIGTDLAELLKDICTVKGKFFMRVGMMNPCHAMEILDRLIEAYKDERIFKFLHLPVQSGDDEVLELMNRPYTAEDFKTIVYSFRKEIPQITLATDIICGFPGESEEAFQRSVELIEEIRPDVLNISKFFPRPKTSAEKMEQIPVQEVKERSLRLSTAFWRICHEKNHAWLNWEGEIIVDEKGKGGSWVGRNFAYKPIVVKSRKKLLGKFLQVKVEKAFPTYLVAEIA